MNAAGRTPLIVDDDAFFRMALSTILVKELGCSEVIEATSFDEAIERLSEHAGISLALFDLSMPGMRSPANLKVVRESFPDVHVVVVSASTARRDVLMALEAGAHGYVPKSLGIAELTQALRAVFKGTIYVPSFLPNISPGAEEPSLASPGPPTAGALPPLTSLTPRQQDVLDLLVKGKSNKEIARALRLGEGTVKIHVAALFRNLGVHSRAAAAAAGARLFSGAQEHSKKLLQR